MRVLHVIDVMTLGGAQALALRVMDGLDERDVQNEFCVLMGEGRTDAIWNLRGRPAYLDFDGDYRNAVTWHRCCRRLRRLIGDVHPDVVISTNWLADVTAARACAAAHVPHVAYLVDRRAWLESPAWKHRYRRWLTRRAFDRANTRFMAVSEAVADFVAAHLPLDRNRIEVVRNSIRVSDFAEVAEERLRGKRLDTAPSRKPKVTVGMLSRLETEKGHVPFLEAVSILARRGGVALHVKIAGQGPLRNELERRINEEGLDGIVSFAGRIDDARDFYRECDIFAVPSINSEGLPTTILEAMAAGCVVVASDVGGAGEVIDNGVNGVIVEARNPEALARSLGALIDHDDRRAEYQARARDKALREFDMEEMIDKVEDVLCRAVRQPHAPQDSMAMRAI